MPLDPSKLVPVKQGGFSPNNLVPVTPNLETPPVGDSIQPTTTSSDITTGQPAIYKTAERPASLWEDLTNLIKGPAEQIAAGFKGMAQAPMAMASASGQIPPGSYTPDTPQQSIQAFTGTLQASMGALQLSPTFLLGGIPITLAEHLDPTGAISAAFNLPNKAAEAFQPTLDQAFMAKGMTPEDARTLSSTILNAVITGGTLAAFHYAGKGLKSIYDQYHVDPAEIDATIQNVASGLRQAMGEPQEQLKAVAQKQQDILTKFESTLQTTEIPTFQQPSKGELEAGAKSGSTQAVEFGKTMNDAQREAIRTRQEQNKAAFEALKDPATKKVPKSKFKEAAQLAQKIAWDSEVLRASVEANPLPKAKKPTAPETDAEFAEKVVKAKKQKPTPIPALKTPGFWGQFKNSLIRNAGMDVTPIMTTIRPLTALADRMLSGTQVEVGRMSDWMRKQADPNRLDFLFHINRGAIEPKDFNDLAVKTGTNAQWLSDQAKAWKTIADAQYASEQANGVKYGYRENYVPGLFKNPVQAEQFLSRMRKMGSEKWFEKHRYFDDLEEALKNNQLKTTDPWELLWHRVDAGNKAIIEHQLTDECLRTGIFHKISNKAAIPEGWAEAPISKDVAGAGKRVIAPIEATKTLSAFMSRGLYGNNSPWGTGFRKWMHMKSFVTVMKIGASAFHGFTTGIEATDTQILHGLHNMWTMGIMEKDPTRVWQGMKDIIEAPIAAVTHNTKGKDLIYAYYHPSEATLSQQAALKTLDMMGFSPGVSSIERLSMRATGEKFFPEYWRNIKQSFGESVSDLVGPNWKTRGTGAERLIGTIAESVGYPLMEVHIPRIKTYAALLRAADWMEAHPGASEGEMRIGLSRIADDLDNRFGEIRYKNLFMQRYMKDALTGMTLSYGWSFGTLRWGAGAIADIPKAIATREMTERQMTALIEPLTVMTIGALTTYFMTGKGPQQWLDYFYPPNGRTRPDGSPDRISIPGQHKEFFALANATMGAGGMEKRGIFGPTMGLADYAGSKLTPLLTTGIDILKNSDYSQREIYSPYSPAHKQVWDAAAFGLGNTLLPISVESYLREKSFGAKGAALVSFLGASPAPGYVTRSKIQNQIFTIADTRNSGVRSKETAEAQSTKSRIRQMIREGNMEQARQSIAEAVQNGTISPNGVSAFVSHSGFHSDALALMGLQADDQLNLATQMNPQELAKYWLFLKAPVRAKIMQGGFTKDADTFLKLAQSGKLKLGDR